mmetsp:Transcript_23949/g.62604  ORF Transcript_23949/g.62604 Transcript_23949/m.62604 type:complete len:206 (+) Transcript_23949:308-925(+)|eukprot:CAMPEP_0206312106 /NCGR_PEP_ID=MMETSP0106_2-20121207/13815_1 /ASSEMBLY_ACC=CAM_ASM_000206 /TAXON_ID=81532 /ORGANISM="Acanthoeca-like sp., Strain 10tr" /LENGTH=205 /DNA_ID=CAMNT_0053743389 /DNA_START=254 /DNA_END=871 /DNA_ORIENTATION=+
MGASNCSTRGLAATLLLLMFTNPAPCCGSCPDLPSLRSPSVVRDFSASRLKGLWYEWAYQDPAQVLSSCQTLNATLHPSGVVDMAFSVKYGPVPFTIVEIYTPNNATANSSGVYRKTVDEPGAKYAALPTVFVDVTANSASDSYETMTIFSCVEELGVTVTEVIFAGRTPQPDGDKLAQMEAVAKTAGVTWKNSSFHTSKCAAQV